MGGVGGRGCGASPGALCFQLVFDMLVLQKHSTEMTTAAGEAFYTLVCLHQVARGVRARPRPRPS